MGKLQRKLVIGFLLIAIMVFGFLALIQTNDMDVDYRYRPKSIEKTQTEQRKWYEGGTLHKAAMKEWSSASSRNKLATAADFVIGIMLKEGADEMSIDIDFDVRLKAIRLVAALDAANKDGIANEQKVAEVVAVIHLVYMDVTASKQ